MRVRLTDEAKAKLRAIRAHIAEDAPQHAEAMIDRVTRHAEKIGDFPRAGRMVPEYRLDTLREVLEQPYRIIYRIGPDQIEVLTVMHYRQLLPDDLV